MGYASQIDTFHEMAAGATGLDDFGLPDYLEPMRLVLSDYDKHSQFSERGMQNVSASFVGLLAGRLIAQQGFAKHPEFVNSPITRPIVIVGMMRTGTTALLQLLSKDPGNQWLPPWLACFPEPRPPRETWESNPWYQQTAKALENIFLLHPDVWQSHPMVAGGPDECRFSMDQSFWSPGLAVTASVPEYAQWCLSADVRYAYRRYRKVLSLIAGGDTRRWLLKDPSHLWAFDSFSDVFRDACIVYMHRDPVTAMAPMASLVYALRHVNEPLPPEQIGREVLAYWGQAQHKAETVRNSQDPARFFDVHVNELHADPVGTAERIYRHFNFPVTEDARHAWRQHVTNPSNAGRSTKQIKPEDFGFTAADVMASIGSYADRYEKLYGTAA